MLVTSQWPGFVQLLAAHERLWSPITQLETCWFYTIGILQTGEIIQAEKFYQFLSRNIVSAYCLIGHTFPRTVSTFEVSIPTPNCFGVDFTKATRRNSLILKDPLFMIRVMDSPRSVARDHPRVSGFPLGSSSHHRDTEAAWQWSWHHRDVSRQICVTPLVTLPLLLSRPLCLLFVIIATGCLSKTV